MRERGAPGGETRLRLRGGGLGQRQGGAVQCVAQRELVEQQTIGGGVPCHKLREQPVAVLGARRVSDVGMALHPVQRIAMHHLVQAPQGGGRDQGQHQPHQGQLRPPARRRALPCAARQGGQPGPERAEAVARHGWVVVLACDAPLVDRELIEGLLRLAVTGNSAAMVRQGGFWQPMFSVLPKRVLPVLEQAWAAGERSLQKALLREAVQGLECAESDRRLSNFNSPERLQD